MSGFCQQTCGTCSSGCTDIPPDATYTCPQQAWTLLCFGLMFASSIASSAHLCSCCHAGLIRKVCTEFHAGRIPALRHLCKV